MAVRISAEVHPRSQEGCRALPDPMPCEIRLAQGAPVKGAKGQPDSRKRAPMTPELLALIKQHNEHMGRLYPGPSKSKSR